MFYIQDFEEVRSRRDRFIQQTKFYAPCLKKYKMMVSFKGYNEVWNNYFAIDSLDMNGLFNLSKELIMWKNYFANLKYRFKMRYNASRNKMLYLESFRTKRKNNLLEQQIEELNEEYFFLRDYSKLLERQEKNFNRAISHCLQLYTEGIGTAIKSIG